MEDERPWLSDLTHVLHIPDVQTGRCRWRSVWHSSNPPLEELCKGSDHQREGRVGGCKNKTNMMHHHFNKAVALSKYQVWHCGYERVNHHLLDISDLILREISWDVIRNQVHRKKLPGITGESNIYTVSVWFLQGVDEAEEVGVEYAHHTHYPPHSRCKGKQRNASHMLLFALVCKIRRPRISRYATEVYNCSLLLPLWY